MSNTRTAKPAPLVFDQDDMTIGELDDFHDLTGYTFGVDSHAKVDTGEVDGKGKPVLRSVPKPKVLAALVYLVRRRTDPGYTFEDARAEKVTALEAPASRPRPTRATASSAPGLRSVASSPATRSRRSAS